MKIILCCLSIFFYQNVFAQNEVILTTKDIQTLVEARNERVIGKSRQTQAMEYRQGYLKRSFLPSLKIHAAQEKFQLGDNYRRTQPNYGAELSVNLFNGTKDSLYDQVVDKRKERAGSEKRVTLYNEVIRAKEIYWNLIFLENTLTVFEEVKQINSNNLQSAVRRIKAGIATTADQFEFEIKETEIKRNIEQVQIQRKVLERELLNILGFDESRVVVFKDKLDHFDGMEKLANHSESQHQFLAKPALVAAEENEISAKIQSRSWWPKVDAYLARNQYNVRNGNVFDVQEGKETVLGIRLTMDILDFSNGNREAAALKAEAQASKSEAKYLERQIGNEAHSEIASLQFLHQQIHVAEENVKKAQGYFKVTLSEYSRGVKNSPDVLGSVDKLLDVKTKYYEILRDFYITRDHLLTKNEI